MKSIAISLLMLFGCMHTVMAQPDFHADFEARRTVFNDNRYYQVFNRRLTDDERQCLEFLYAYMPLADITDYDGDFWMQNVSASLQAKREMPWGKSIPQREWLHFVLPVRANNENLDESRTVFFNELKNRVKDMSMEQAALEVNHWCHEKVSYQPSDSRTSAPLAAVRSAIGRCGEESTFCVAAMRSVGIPARQVYTPRWAHTDDNHAWVEVWIDGRWRFLGACEPEAVLDLGWFNAPASRGMLMHTKVFGNYDGPEEVMNRTNCFTEINVTRNYAPTAIARIQVVDKSEKPVAGAKIEYKLYNYAEFFSVATKESDANGISTISAGRGDFLVWASKDGLFGIGKCSVGKDQTVTIKLDKPNDFVGNFDIDLVPPAERNNIPHQTEEQISENKRRFAYEDSIRQAYINTFHKGDEFVEGSRGNYFVIESFMKRHPDIHAKNILRYLSAKDLRDVTLDVLEDAYVNTTPSGTSADDNDRYMLSQRVSNELLTPYRTYFRNTISADNMQRWKQNPETLVDWTAKNIRIDNEWNPQRLCMSPQSVYEHRTTDSHSRDIFFVALARSIGIYARVDMVTGKTQWLRRNGEWADADFSKNANATQNAAQQQGTMIATYKQGAGIDDPKYYTHFSISKMVDASPQLLNYDENGVTWSSLLKDGTTLDQGNYLIVSGTRMADGSVLCHLEFVPVSNATKATTRIVLRESDEGVRVIGNFNSENLYKDDTDGVKTLLSTTGRGYYIIGVIAPVEEPTNHALRDIALLQKDLEAWGQKIVLLFENDDEKARFTNKSEFTNLPSTIVWGTDVDGKIFAEMKKELKLKSNNRPVFLIADTFNRVVFMSQGYSIGLGEQLMKVIKKL